METIKVNISKIKSDIKKLAENQKFLKNQRKTVNLKGTRVKEPWEAAYEHQRNRQNLRLMYAAYGVIRGKLFSQIENKYSEENHPLNNYKDSIDDIILNYLIEE